MIFRGIDLALNKLGAETETNRRARIRNAWDNGDIETAKKIRTCNIHKKKSRADQ